MHVYMYIYKEIEILSRELYSVGRTAFYIKGVDVWISVISYLFILKVKFLATRLFNKKKKTKIFDSVVNFLENHYNTWMRMWSKINSKLNTKLVEHKKLLQN
jgi:hypothetical protein